MAVPQNSINTFERGMNSDLAKTLQQPNTYLEALNFRLITEEGQSTGALVNIKGTELKVTFPNVGTGVQDMNLVPMGWCTIRDDIYVFTTAAVNTTDNPGGVNPNLPADPQTKGQIWKLTYDKVTFVVTTTLLYDNFMNLSLKYPIANPGMIEGRYENNANQRIYWTDNLNPLRVINVADPLVANTPLAVLDIVSDINFQLPIVEDILDGNLPEGVFQVVFRLGSKDGSLTKFSFPSFPIELISGDLYGPAYEYPLSDSLNPDNDTTNSEKAVKIKITNIDSNYDYIQLAYIVYTSKGNPQVKLLSESLIPSSGIYTEVISGNEEGVQIFTIDELTALSNPFKRVGTITQKNNILFAGDTETDQFDVEFDARTYRYKDDGSTYVTFPVAETADAINPYNDESSPSWLSGNQYKFKSDGTTIGGEGPNVSYTFITQDIITDVDSSDPLGAPFINVNHQNTTETLLLNNTYPVKSFTNFKSPFVSSLYTGHARGEVYRYGLILWSKKGNPSFVKWIGDIKFPFATDTGFDLASFSGDTLTLKSIGIQFTISIPNNLHNQVSGYSIVRVLRTENDRTKLGWGATGAFRALESEPLTIDDFILIFLDLAFNLAKSLVSNDNSGIFSLFAGGIAQQIKDALDKALQEIKGGNAGTDTLTAVDGYKSLTDESLRAIVKHAFMTIGGPLVGILVDSLVGERLAEYIAEAMEDFIRPKIAGIDNLLYSIGDSIEGKKLGYVISPIVSFDRYKYRNNDYLRLIGRYNASNSKIVKSYDTQNVTGSLIRDNSVAAYRKWYNYTLYTSSDNKRTIDKSKVLEVGEMLNNGFDPVTLGTEPNAYTLVNAYIGDIERWLDGGIPLIDPSTGIRPMRALGIGDIKQLVVLDEVMPTDTDTVFVEDDPVLTPLDYPRVLDKGGDYLVSYERYLTDQYGGNTYTDRLNSTYIFCNNYVPIAQGSSTFKVFGGDTYVSVFDAVNYAYYFKEISGYRPPFKLKKALAEMIPVEIPFNLDLREEIHFARNQDKDDLNIKTRREKRRERRAKRRAARKGLELRETTIDSQELELALQRFVFDQFNYKDVYDQPNNILTFIPKPLIDRFNEQQSHGVWYSEEKFDGEYPDSWRIFKPNNLREVEGTLGKITMLINHKDKLWFIQDKGLGIFAVNETALTATSVGETVLGTGGVLSRYDYISRETGSKHKFGFVNTDTAFYFYDVYSNKLVMVQGGTTVALSDLKGITGFLNRTITGELLNNDNPVLGLGICATNDFKFNEILFTFHDTDNQFTIAFNEQANAFTSFYSFLPGMYINDRYNIFSSPLNTNRVYAHNKGDYGNFYGTVFPSTLTVLSNKYPNNTKVFDDISYYSEARTPLDVDVPNNTFGTVQCTTDYQSSAIVALTNLNTIRLVERSWKLQVPRNIGLDRLRDKALKMKFTYDNTPNYKFTCNYINTHFRVSAR
jgi:hypothetical protein